MTTIRSISELENETSTSDQSANSIVHEYLVQNESVFKRLTDLRSKGWDNPQGDEYFKKQRQRADNSKGQAAAYRFYNMMRQIGDELQLNTGALSQALHPGENVQILDLCMAPGGYTASALKYNPGGKAFGITLPPKQGGHEILLKSSQSTVQYLDITMLAKEFGVDNVPITHPEHASFLDQRPFYGQTFDLVFCDGQVLRTHQRAEHREYFEATRLNVSQLILALQRIRPGGTLIMLLHKIEAWHTIELLYRFSKFASIQVFKPMKKHAIRSSFYFIARGVQSDGQAAKEAVGIWKQAWWNATFGGESGTGVRSVPVDEEFVGAVIDQFGERLIELGRPIWETQAIALDKMDFVHGKS